VLRLVVAPAAVAAFAVYELWREGPLVAIGFGWVVFVVCVIAIDAWGRFQLERTRRRIQALRARGSRNTR